MKCRKVFSAIILNIITSEHEYSGSRYTRYAEAASDLFSRGTVKFRPYSSQLLQVYSNPVCVWVLLKSFVILYLSSSYW
jgi:hypothetical protein